jgi:putative tryptophan/tyrosine transport system substrate-binding protein
MKRRGFIAVVGGAAAWPLAGHAQQPQLRRVGVLTAYRENDPSTQPFVTAFVQALERFGWAEGKNIQIDYRFAAGDPALFKSYAADLVELSPDAILASSSLPVAALRQQTRTIPIVFAAVGDPVGQGFVQSLAQPGGNITGFSSADALLYGKWLQLLKEIAPRVTRVAVIFNPDATPAAALFNAAIDAIGAAAPSLGVSVTLAPVRDDSEIEPAIAAQAREPGGGLIDYPDGGFTTTHRDVIIAAAARQRLPMIGWHAVSRAGGLMSYWFDPADSFTGAASYIDRILKGAKPADLPVQQPTKYSLIVNLKTANALGLTVSQSILQRADEVIE